jgi:sec-independent protein translocase protein TatA
MGALSPLHLILIVLIVLVLFGSKRLVGLGKGLGESLRGFRESVAGDEGAPTRRPDLVEASDEEVKSALVDGVGPKGAVRAKQMAPAPTPEIAEAEVAAAETARREREPESQFPAPRADR